MNGRKIKGIKTKRKLLLESQNDLFHPHGVANLFLVGVEGSSHHGISMLIPELNMLAYNSTRTHCLRVRWSSYPSKESGMNEKTRISLIYGNTCQAPQAWKTNCGEVGKWRCEDAEEMYEELLFRFGTWKNFNSLTSRNFFNEGYRFIILRRDFVRSVISHTSNNRHPWDGHMKSHALVLAAHTTLMSAMLAKITTDRWVTVDPEHFSNPTFRTTVGQALLMWFEWPVVPAFELDQRISTIWHPSKRDAANLDPETHKFLYDLIRRRRSDGSWAAYDDPNQNLLSKVLQGKAGAHLNKNNIYSEYLQHVNYNHLIQSNINTQEKETKDISKISLSLDEFKDKVLFITQNDTFIDNEDTSSMIIGYEKQSVTWHLSGKYLGPFPKECKAPEWSLLDASWPRD